MFFALKTRGAHQYLQLVESVHVKGKKYPQKRVVKNLGRFDKLPAEILQQYQDEKKRKALADKLAHDTRLQTLTKASKAVSDAQNEENQPTPHFNRAFALRYGHLALKGIWDRDLGLRYKLDYIQKTRTNITAWRLNDLLFYLCAVKLLAPDSYLGASESRSNYLYCPWNNVAQDNFYAALDIVSENAASLVEHAVKTRLSQKKTDIKVAFFDCTNTWFETPYDDVTWQVIRYTRRRREELDKEGLSAEEIEKYLGSEDFARDLAEELESNKDQVLRMRGKSKEGRYSQPIVTVALAIDQTGFPIDCEVFAGNISETKTIKPMLESLKQKYNVKDVYFVADRGLNSAQGLDTIRDNKLGFVVAQSVSRQKPAIRKEMLNLQGYKNFRLTEDGEFQTVDADETLRTDSFRFKVCDHVKETTVKDKSGNSKTVKVKCKIVYTFSPERKARDEADLKIQIAKASKAISEGCLMGNPYGTGWRALIKTRKEATEGKEDKEQYRATGLKDEVIADRKAIAGYAAIVFAHPDGENIEHLTDTAVLSMYHRLVNIEDCFRVMKSDFSIRPMHVRLYDRIKGHCCLCVLSLMMLKILQEKAEAAGDPMSAVRIKEALTQAMLLPIPSADGNPVSFINIGTDPKFHTAERCGKGRDVWELNETVNSEEVWRRYEAERSRQASDTDRLFSAVGLKPLQLYNTLAEIKVCMGLHSTPDELMLAPEHKGLSTKLGQAEKTCTSIR